MGYFNLVKLVSQSFLETIGDEAAQIGIDDLASHAESIICLTGGVNGPVGRLLAAHQPAAAEQTLLKLAGIFPGRLYVELQRHGMAEEDAIEEALIDLAYKHDLPLVATNNAFFATPDFYEAHDVLLCIADGVTLNALRPQAPDPAALFQVGRRDAGAVRRSAGGLRQFPGDRPAAVPSC